MTEATGAGRSQKPGASRTTFPKALPLDELERASGLVLGVEADAVPLPETADTDARAVLGDVIRQHLERGPCFVSFSGGRDSSSVLATAVATARASGLPEPIPVTQRFPGVASTDENEWQETVLNHLRLRQWERITITDELDLLGPLATQGLKAHGLLYPPNSFFHEPMFARAQGGTLLTGFDGDGLFAIWRWAHAQQVLHGRVRPQPRDALRVGLALAPRPLKRMVIKTPWDRAAPWLRPAAQQELGKAGLEYVVREPRSWSRRVHYYSRNRHLRVTSHSLGLLAQKHRVTVAHPLTDSKFLAARDSVTGLGSCGRCSPTICQTS